MRGVTGKDEREKGLQRHGDSETLRKGECPRVREKKETKHTHIQTDAVAEIHRDHREDREMCRIGCRHNTHIEDGGG